MRYRNRSMTMGPSVAVALILLFCLMGCDRAARTAATPATEWSTEEMVIHQLRELLRYEELEHRQRLDELEALSLPRAGASFSES
ncbi:MAG: hypothetical protein AB2588_14760 [Candidatus Thiodiazotropha sp.]